MKIDSLTSEEWRDEWLAQKKAEKQRKAKQRRKNFDLNKSLAKCEERMLFPQ